MNYLKLFLSNFPLICAGTAWFSAQILKVFTGVFRQKTFNVIELLFGTGGMPSSHTAAVCAMAVATGLYCGVQSAVFALAVLFAIITMRDATGVRRETGEQAKVLNRIMHDLLSSSDIHDVDRNLKELVGHTPLQVAVGALVGVAIPFLMALIPYYRGLLMYRI